jgi:hypothetical protein
MGEHLLEFLALFLLRSKNQKVKNGNQWEEQKKRVKDVSHTPH